MWKKIDKFMLTSSKIFATTVKIFLIPFIIFAYFMLNSMQKEMGEIATTLSVVSIIAFLIVFVIDQLQKYSPEFRESARLQHKEYKNKFLNSISKKFVKQARIAEKRKAERKKWPF